MTDFTDDKKKKLKNRRIPNKGKRCSVHLYHEDAVCEKPAFCKGLCKSHYLKWYKYGTPVTWFEERPLTCLREGCDLPVHSKGFCKFHYRKLRYNREKVALTKKPSVMFPCENCGKPSVRSFIHKLTGKPMDFCQDCIDLMVAKISKEDDE